MSAGIFHVSITVTTLVQADDSAQAARVAKDEFRDIAADTLPRHMAVGVMSEITALTGLPTDWDGRCLPYGGDGNTRLDKILPKRATLSTAPVTPQPDSNSPEFDGIKTVAPQAEGTVTDYGTPQQAVAGDEQKFNAIRLRRAATLVGLARAIPESDADLLGCMGTVLGMICRKIEDDRAALSAPVAQADSDEDAYVIDRLGKLLAGVAIALNGPEPELTRWSYHDLPEKAQLAMLELEIFRAREATLAKAEQTDARNIRVADTVAQAGAHGGARSAVLGGKNDAQPLGKGDRGDAEPAPAGALTDGQILELAKRLLDGNVDEHIADPGEDGEERDGDMFVAGKLAGVLAMSKAVRALLAAAPRDRAAPAAVAGWQLVPKVLTDDMAVAFCEVWYSKARAFDDPEMDDAYAALLAAAELLDRHDPGRLAIPSGIADRRADGAAAAPPGSAAWT